MIFWTVLQIYSKVIPLRRVILDIFVSLVFFVFLLVKLPKTLPHKLSWQGKFWRKLSLTVCRYIAEIPTICSKSFFERIADFLKKFENYSNCVWRSEANSSVFWRILRDAPTGGTLLEGTSEPLKWFPKDGETSGKIPKKYQEEIINQSRSA